MMWNLTLLASVLLNTQQYFARTGGGGWCACEQHVPGLGGYGHDTRGGTYHHFSPSIFWSHFWFTFWGSVLGGVMSQGDRTPEEGASTAVALATLPVGAGGPRGGMLRDMLEVGW